MAGDNGGRLTRLKVLLYIPNLIGYLRVAVTLAAFYIGTNPVVIAGQEAGWEWVIGLYFAGFFGDLVDGWAARKFNQSSQFGAVLDMVTDRTATAGLVMLNLSADQQHAFWWIALVLLDIASHWFHCFSTAKTGHHKAESALRGRNPVLRLYYGFYPFFGFCCVGQEVFYLAHYILRRDPEALHSLLADSIVEPFLPPAISKAYIELPNQGLRLLRKVAFVGCILKQIVNLAQLASAAGAFADMDLEVGVTGTTKKQQSGGGVGTVPLVKRTASGGRPSSSNKATTTPEDNNDSGKAKLLRRSPRQTSK